MKILFFANDPGGANAIAPLIPALESKHTVFVYGKGAALKILPNVQILSPYMESFSKTIPKYLEKLLFSIQPDLLITGTSGSDFTERYLWQLSQKMHIKSIAILDHWVNYGVRFSKWATVDRDKFTKQCDFLPSYIIVMDDFAKEEMVADGVPPDIILPLGNPHFEKIMKTAQPNYDRKNSDKTHITFASEPLIEDYGKGYEIDIVQSICNYIKNKDMKFVIRLHPRECISKYKNYENNNIIIDKNIPTAELIAQSDIIVSQSSMFLIEAMLQNKPCISYQPNCLDENAFILTKNGDLSLITTEKCFYEELDTILSGNKIFSYKLLLKRDIIKDIILFIEGESWRN